MKILAMDTATNACSVACGADGAILSRRFEAMGRGQAEALVPMIETVLGEAGLKAPELDLLAVTVGPGAFTGLRIGLATARGLALAAGVPCIGLTTTEAIAAGVAAGDWPGGGILVALDSKRSDLYVQTFTPGPRPAAEPAAVEPDRLSSWLGPVDGPLGVVGDAAEAALEALRAGGLEAVAVDAAPHPDAARMIPLAAGRGQPSRAAEAPSPLYLRPPDAKLPRDGGRLRP